MSQERLMFRCDEKTSTIVMVLSQGIEDTIIDALKDKFLITVLQGERFEEEGLIGFIFKPSKDELKEWVLLLKTAKNKSREKTIDRGLLNLDNLNMN